MVKAVLISLAALVSFDAVAWHSAMREQIVRQTSDAIAGIVALDWNWG